eukprot:6664168-Pyramimonas_sp.AAC.1
MRTALVTLPHWQATLRMLRDGLVEHCPAALWHSPLLAPAFWQSPPLVLNLEAAAQGFPGDRRLRVGGARAVGRFLEGSAIPGPKWQRIFAAELQAEVFSLPLEGLLERRVRS